MWNSLFGRMIYLLSTDTFQLFFLKVIVVIP